MRKSIADQVRARREILKASGVRVRPRGRPVRSLPPLTAKVEYYKYLLQRQKDLAALVRAEVLPRLEGIIGQMAQETGVRQDASAFDTVALLFSNLKLKFAERHSSAEVAAKTGQVARSVDVKNSQEFQKQARAALGVEIIRPEPFRQIMIEGFVKENIGLVESLSGGALASLEQIILRGVRAGKRVKDLAREIEDKLSVTKAKAALLARDQTLKLFGELSEMRQRSVGVEEYTWDTSKDESVRSAHATLEGTVHKWTDPPVVDPKTGRKAHPGGDFSCRCQAIPVFPKELVG